MNQTIASVLRNVLNEEAIQAMTPDWKGEINYNDELLRRLERNEKIRKIFERVPMIRGRNIILNMRGGAGEISITTLDYTTLESGQTPNDSVMEFALKYIKDHLGSDFSQKQVAVLSPLFMRRIKLFVKRLPRHRYQELVKLVGVREALNKEWMLIPDLIDSRWYLIAIHYPRSREHCQMIIIDPLFTHSHKMQTRLLKNFLKAEFYKLHQKRGSFTFIPIKFMKMPRQQRPEDSGPILMQVAQHLLTNVLISPGCNIPKKIKFSQEQLQIKRREIATALIDSASKYLMCDAKSRLPQLKLLQMNAKMEATHSTCTQHKSKTILHPEDYPPGLQNHIQSLLENTTEHKNLEAHISYGGQVFLVQYNQTWCYEVYSLEKKI